MNQDANLVMKKMLQKITNHVIGSKEYSDFDRIDVFFVFGSKHKTAMCDWVYGIKIHKKSSNEIINDLVRNFQIEIKKRINNMYKQSVCCTDTIFELN